MNHANALKRFHKEHQQLLRARMYLYSAHLVAKSCATELSEQHGTFEDVLAPNYASPHDYFVARLFIAHVSAFEMLLQDLAKFVITRDPKKAAEKSAKFAKILDASGAECVGNEAVTNYLSNLMRNSPLEYFVDLSKLLSIDTAPLESNWCLFIEAKARRDLGVHNCWICNAAYRKKLSKAGICDMAELGENLIPKGNDYLEITLSGILVLAERITHAVKVKHPTAAPQRTDAAGVV
jgi:hypothetical protein